MTTAKKKNVKMEIWDAVCTTDPAHTKLVQQRGGFTAIDAMYQVQTATEQFGPVGIGWGWSVDLIFPPNDTVIAKVELWHGDETQTVTQCGQKKLNNAKGPDEDAAKKAVTDGLTKCLSYLGFNADVFLGKFDDNKYIESMKVEHNPEAKKFNEWAQIATIDLGNIKTAADLSIWVAENQTIVEDALKNPTIKASAMVVMSQYKLIKHEFETNKEKV